MITDKSFNIHQRGESRSAAQLNEISYLLSIQLGKSCNAIQWLEIITSKPTNLKLSHLIHINLAIIYLFSIKLEYVTVGNIIAE